MLIRCEEELSDKHVNTFFQDDDLTSAGIAILNGSGIHLLKVTGADSARAYFTYSGKAQNMTKGFDTRPLNGDEASMK